MDKKWLGCKDSNLGMAESKSADLPLVDTPKTKEIKHQYNC